MPITRRTSLALLGGTALARTAPAAVNLPLPPPPLQFSTAYGDAVFHTQVAHGFARRLALETKGRVEVNVTAGAKLRAMAEVLPALERDEIAFGEVLMSACASMEPLLAMDTLPFIVRGNEDAAHLWKITRAPIGERLLQRGVRLLYAVPWPGQGLYTRKPIDRLTDLKGQKFRVYNDATRRLAELGGAQPVTVAANDLQKAIAGGEVDTMLTSSTTGVDSRAWSSMKVFTDLRAWVPKNMVCIGEPAWQRLDAPTRASVLRAAADAEATGWRLSREADEAAKKTLKANRVAVVAPSSELRRNLDLAGERFSREWAASAGAESTQALLNYYATRSR